MLCVDLMEVTVFSLMHMGPRFPSAAIFRLSEKNIANTQHKCH